jgi:hypothetical protein
MNPSSGAHRILRRLRSFEPASAVDLTKLGTPPLREGESWLGIYWNGAKQVEESLLFSDQRICISRSDEWTCVDYSSIRDVLVPHQKHEAEGLAVLYDWGNDSRQTYVPVHGGRGKLREAYEVMRFLNRVREDLAAGPR